MFYSHEVLTSRRYGVATIWLVATLGARSSLKKLNKKTIVGVDIPRACETLMESGIPMALRLQSTLMYGISRVYAQQCQYVLSDAQLAQVTVRSSLMVAKRAGIDPQAGKAKLSQLVIADDPAFLLDDFLPMTEFDSLQFGENKVHWPMYSPELTQNASTLHSSADTVSWNLVIPSDDVEGIVHFDVPSSADKSRQQHVSQRQTLVPADDMESFDPNVTFGFDFEGNLHEIATANALRVSDKLAHSPIHLNHSEPSLGIQTLDSVIDESHESVLECCSTNDFTQQARQQVPLQSEGHSSANKFDHLSDLLCIPESRIAETKGISQLRTLRHQRVFTTDNQLQIRNTELAIWNDNYCDNMNSVRRRKVERKMARLARVYAARWIFGAGVNATGDISAFVETAHPFKLFSGTYIWEKLTVPFSQRQTSIAQDEEAMILYSEEPKDLPRALNFNITDSVDTDVPIVMAREEPEIEIGRRAKSQAEEYSSQMPWNFIESNIASQEASRQSSVHRPRFVHWATSAHSSDRLAYFSIKDSWSAQNTSSKIDVCDAPSAFPDAPDSDGSPEQVHQSQVDLEERSSEFIEDGMGAAEQIVINRRCPRETLPLETTKFFNYLQYQLRNQQNGRDTRENIEASNWIEFGELLPITIYSQNVAARAFLHLLALASQSLVNLEQADIYFGNIKISMNRLMI